MACRAGEVNGVGRCAERAVYGSGVTTTFADMDLLGSAWLVAITESVMAALFLLLRSSLPGGALMRGAVFGLIAWFFRVLMGTLGQWIAFEIPDAAVAYSIAAGLVEMLLIGLFCGAILRSRPSPVPAPLRTPDAGLKA
jgi:hypothetical protein